MTILRLIIILLIIFIFVAIVVGVGLLIYFSMFKGKEELEITKSISAGIPFKWEVEVENKNIVKYVRSYVVKDENTGGLVGAKVHTNYVFKGLSQGETYIIFKFVNFTNNEVTNEDKYLVKVDDNLNISLVEKDIN